jgi:PEP-CTERM motif
MKLGATHKTFAVIFGLAVAAGLAQSASAASIALINAGFESDLIAANDGNNITPAGWTLFAVGNVLSFVGDGAWQGGAAVTGAHTGDHYFLAHGASGHTTIHQDTGLLWSELTAGDTLTITAWTTYRTDVNGSGTIHFWLNDPDNSGLYSPGMDATDGGSTAAGVWTERSWAYTVTQEKIDQAASSAWGAVNVQIGILNNIGNNQQTLFDDVSLMHTPIPEPSGIALFGLGLGFFALRHKRRP